MVNTERFIDQTIGEIQREVGTHQVVIALSGGVDSSVCAALAARAIGDRLTAIYVDTGLMRKGETDRISAMFGNLRLHIVHAEDEFLRALVGISDPEQKRKVIGERFIRVFGGPRPPGRWRRHARLCQPAGLLRPQPNDFG